MKHLTLLLLLALHLFASIPTYDAMDNLLPEPNQGGETTSYAYDDADRLTKTTYPDGSSTSNSYDKAGRTISTTDQNGNSTIYEYDAVRIGNRGQVIVIVSILLIPFSLSRSSTCQDDPAQRSQDFITSLTEAQNKERSLKSLLIMNTSKSSCAFMQRVMILHSTTTA